MAIDDATRLAFVGVHADERAATTVRFLRDAAAFFADRGVRVEWVMTENAMTYIRSRELARLFAELGIRHLRTRPRRPQTNGKAERFIGTLQREWAYARLFRSTLIVWPRCRAGSTPAIDAVPMPGSMDSAH